VDLLKARAKGMAVGAEFELSVVVDAFYPIHAITQVAREFRQQYPGVALRIFVEALGTAIQPVIDGRCSAGIVGPLPVIPGTLTNEQLSGIWKSTEIRRDSIARFWTSVTSNAPWHWFATSASNQRLCAQHANFSHQLERVAARHRRSLALSASRIQAPAVRYKLNTAAKAYANDRAVAAALYA
jgi:hypothetical protein